MPTKSLSSERQATITDVAERAGVSKKTVSRVINDEANVSEEKRKRVSRAIRDLGFTPNAAARHFARRRLNNIGIIVADLPRWSYYSDVIIGVQHECLKHNYTTSIHPISANNEFSETALYKALRSGALAGLVVTAPCSSDPAFLTRLKSWNANFTCIINDSDSLEHTSIVANDYDGARTIARYLLSLGHTRFAIAAGPRHLSFSRSRLAGFLFELEQANIPEKNVSVLFSKADYESGFEIGSKLMERQDYPTAIFAATDLLAAGMINSLHEQGITIPGDVSIAGFGDLQIASQVWPALTTVHQDTEGMAAAAARLAILKAEGTADVPHHMQFETKLIIRKSTAPPGT